MLKTRGMTILIGMDEAGYGPNLGPLVVSVTAWRIPEPPLEFDFWSAMQPLISQTAPKSPTVLQIADSKEVYSPGRGLRNLEASVLCGLAMDGANTNSLRSIVEHAAAKSVAEFETEPWFKGEDVLLPLLTNPDDLAARTADWQQLCTTAGVELLAMRSDVVLTERFNTLVNEVGSKGQVLTRVTLGLLGQVWDPNSDEPTLVICDKHGGRNRYDEFIAEIVDDHLIQRHDESRNLSRYRVGSTEFRFQTRAEAHLPVALASMLCKYVREVSMELFNGFWTQRVEGLKPTKGYPQDAKRFQADVAEKRAELGIQDATFWRSK